MIGRLSGTLLEKAPPQVLLDVQGVGYELEAPMSTIFALPAEGQAVVLHTHMVVREDAQLLYGFASREERTMFRELLRITGIGAKMALAVLSTMSTSELFSVIEAGDDDRLTRVPGIGKKTAQRVLLEMRGRLSRFEQLGPAGSSASGGAASQDRAEAQDALQALGSGMLRGLKDTAFVMQATTFAYWGVGGAAFIWLFHFKASGAQAVWWVYCAALAAAAALAAPDALIVVLAGAMILGLAGIPNGRAGVMASGPAVYLGEISYSVYMVCIPVKLVAVNLASRLTGAGDEGLSWPVWLALVLMVPVIATGTYHLVEKPARIWLRAHRPGRKGRGLPTANSPAEGFQAPKTIV